MITLNKEWIAEIKEMLARPRNILLTIHFNPDGDSLGSSLALQHYLRKKGHQVRVLAPNMLPESYLWMPGASEIMNYETDTEQAKELIAAAEIIFALDYNELSRTGTAMGKCLSDSGKQFIMIDHHPNPEPFTKYMFSTCKVSSASELTFQFIESLNGTEPIDKPMAECIFTGIMTDTGMFNHNSSRPSTFLTVAKLLEAGIDKDQIKSNVFDNNSTDRLRLMGFCLSERMKVFPEYRTGYIALRMEDLKRFNFKRGDHDGFVNFPLSVKNIRFSALIIENEDLIKISMRSKGDFDVNQFMRENFAGGGHKNASGGRSFDSFEQVVEKFESLLPKYQEELLTC